MKLKDSETFKNLQTSLKGECVAYTTYLIFSQIAKEQGFGYIGDIFAETADNEKEHAEQWLKLIREGKEESVYDNLIEAMKTEHYENAIMYKNFEEKAREEGFIEIADEFKRVGSVEYHHESRYQILANLLDEQELFHSNKQIIWKCSACGYEIKSDGAPLKCPLCGHEQGFYYPKKKIYY